MTRPDILFAIGCNLDDIYRTRIEASCLAECGQVEVWDIGTYRESMQENGYTRRTHALLPFRRMLSKTLPQAILTLIRHCRLSAACMLVLAEILLLPALLLPARSRPPSSSASPATPAEPHARLKAQLRRWGLYNHAKSVAFLVLLLRHAMTHYDAWLNQPKRYDILHIKDVDTLLFGALLKLHLGTRLIYNCYEFSRRSMPETPRWLSCIVGHYENSMTNTVDTVITVTPSMAEQLRQSLRLCIPVHWVPNVDPLPQSTAGAPADTFAQANGRIIFYYQGTFSAERGFEELIAAWAQVKSPRAALFLRGPENENARHYRAMAERLGLLNTSLYFLPPIASSGKETLEKSLSYLAQADAGLILYDPACVNNKNACPRKLSHYLLAGKMLIATPMNYVASIIREAECGIVLPALSPETIAAAVNRIIADPALIARCQQNARTYAQQQYHWGCFKEHYLKAVLEDKY